MSIRSNLEQWGSHQTVFINVNLGTPFAEHSSLFLLLPTAHTNNARNKCYKSRKYLDLRDTGFLLKYIQQFPQLHHQQEEFYMANKVLIFEMLVAPWL